MYVPVKLGTTQLCERHVDQENDANVQVHHTYIRTHVSININKQHKKEIIKHMKLQRQIWPATSILYQS